MVDLDQEEVPQESAESPENEQRGGMGFLTKILMIVGVLVFQVAAAYFGLQYFFFNKTPTVVDTRTVDRKFDEVGPILELEELVVNPAGSMGRRFVVVKVALELTHEDVQKNIDQQMPLIDDELIRILSSKNIEYLSNVASRDSLREEMRLAINDRLPGSDGVSKLFFTGFVLQ